MRITYIFSIIFCTLMLHGCSSSPSTPADSSSLLAYEYSNSLNAKVLQAIQGDPLNLTIRINEGSLIKTAPKSYTGEEHGFLWWKHRWQEQTRFTIYIRPAGVGTESVLEVYAETFHRKNPNFEWEKFDTPKNEERATKVMNYILRALGGGNVS